MVLGKPPHSMIVGLVKTYASKITPSTEKDITNDAIKHFKKGIVISLKLPFLEELSMESSRRFTTRNKSKEEQIHRSPTTN